MARGGWATADAPAAAEIETGLDEAEELGYALPKEKRGDEDEEEEDDTLAPSKAAYAEEGLRAAAEPPEDGGVAMEGWEVVEVGYGRCCCLAPGALIGRIGPCASLCVMACMSIEAWAYVRARGPCHTVK